MSRTFDDALRRSENRVDEHAREILQGKKPDSPFGVFMRRQEIRGQLDNEYSFLRATDAGTPVTIAQWEKWHLPLVEYHKEMISYFANEGILPPFAYQSQFSDDMRRIYKSTKAAGFSNAETINFHRRIAEALLNVLFIDHNEGWKEDTIKLYLDPVKVAVRRWHSRIIKGFRAKQEEMKLIDDPYGKQEDGKEKD